mgnify:CR=1 FL=1
MKTFRDLTELEDPGKLRDAGMKVMWSYLKKFEKDFHKTLSSIENYYNPLRVIKISLTLKSRFRTQIRRFKIG